MPAPGRLRQEDCCRFEARLGYGISKSTARMKRPQSIRVLRLRETLCLGPGPREMALWEFPPQGHRAREGTEKPASPQHLGAPQPPSPGSRTPSPCLPSSTPGTSDLECSDPTVIRRLSEAPGLPPSHVCQAGERKQGPRHTVSRAGSWPGAGLCLEATQPSLLPPLL